MTSSITSQLADEIPDVLQQMEETNVGCKIKKQTVTLEELRQQLGQVTGVRKDKKIPVTQHDINDVSKAAHEHVTDMSSHSVAGEMSGSHPNVQYSQQHANPPQQIPASAVQPQVVPSVHQQQINASVIVQQGLPASLGSQMPGIQQNVSGSMSQNVQQHGVPLNNQAATLSNQQNVQSVMQPTLPSNIQSIKPVGAPPQIQPNILSVQQTVPSNNQQNTAAGAQQQVLPSSASQHGHQASNMLATSVGGQQANLYSNYQPQTVASVGLPPTIQQQKTLMVNVQAVSGGNQPAVPGMPQNVLGTSIGVQQNMQVGHSQQTVPAGQTVPTAIQQPISVQNAVAGISHALPTGQNIQSGIMQQVVPSNVGAASGSVPVQAGVNMVQPQASHIVSAAVQPGPHTITVSQPVASSVTTQLYSQVVAQSNINQAQQTNMPVNQQLAISGSNPAVHYSNNSNMQNESVLMNAKITGINNIQAPLANAIPQFSSQQVNSFSSFDKNMSPSSGVQFQTIPTFSTQSPNTPRASYNQTVLTSTQQYHTVSSVPYQAAQVVPTQIISVRPTSYAEPVPLNAQIHAMYADNSKQIVPNGAIQQQQAVLSNTLQFGMQQQLPQQSFVGNQSQAPHVLSQQTKISQQQPSVSLSQKIGTQQSISSTYQTPVGQFPPSSVYQPTLASNIQQQPFVSPINVIQHPSIQQPVLPTAMYQQSVSAGVYQQSVPASVYLPSVQQQNVPSAVVQNAAQQQQHNNLPGVQQYLVPSGSQQQGSINSMLQQNTIAGVLPQTVAASIQQQSTAGSSALPQTAVSLGVPQFNSAATQPQTTNMLAQNHVALGVQQIKPVVVNQSVPQQSVSTGILQQTIQQQYAGNYQSPPVYQVDNYQPNISANVQQMGGGLQQVSQSQSINGVPSKNIQQSFPYQQQLSGSIIPLQMLSGMQHQNIGLNLPQQQNVLPAGNLQISGSNMQQQTAAATVQQQTASSVQHPTIIAASVLHQTSVVAPAIKQESQGQPVLGSSASTSQQPSVATQPTSALTSNQQHAAVHTSQPQNVTAGGHTASGQQADSRRLEPHLVDSSSITNSSLAKLQHDLLEALHPRKLMGHTDTNSSDGADLNRKMSQLNVNESNDDHIRKISCPQAQVVQTYNTEVDQHLRKLSCPPLLESLLPGQDVLYNLPNQQYVQENIHSQPPHLVQDSLQSEKAHAQIHTGIETMQENSQTDQDNTSSDRVRKISRQESPTVPSHFEESRDNSLSPTRCSSSQLSDENCVSRQKTKKGRFKVLPVVDSSTTLSNEELSSGANQASGKHVTNDLLDGMPLTKVTNEINSNCIHDVPLPVQIAKEDVSLDQPNVAHRLPIQLSTETVIGNDKNCNVVTETTAHDVQSQEILDINASIKQSSLVMQREQDIKRVRSDMADVTPHQAIVST